MALEPGIWQEQVLISIFLECMDAEIRQTYPTMILTHRFLMNSTMERQRVHPPPKKKPRSEINRLSHGQGI